MRLGGGGRHKTPQRESKPNGKVEEIFPTGHKGLMSLIGSELLNFKKKTKTLIGKWQVI